MTFDDLRNLDIRDLNPGAVSEWPRAGRALLLGAVLVAVLAIGYAGFVRARLDALAAARGQEVQMKYAFAHKQRLAAELAAYREQLAQLRQGFAGLRHALPERGEMDGLLRDISRTARADGLAQKLFQPKAERIADFYAEQPIAMEYFGSYRQIVRFAREVSALPRIVNLRDFSLQPVQAGDGARLDFRVTAVAYRYLAPDELERYRKQSGSKE